MTFGSVGDTSEWDDFCDLVAGPGLVKETSEAFVCNGLVGDPDPAKEIANPGLVVERGPRVDSGLLKDPDLPLDPGLAKVPAPVSVPAVPSVHSDHVTLHTLCRLRASAVGLPIPLVGMAHYLLGSVHYP